MKHKRMKLFFSPEQNYFKADGGRGRGLGGPPGSAVSMSDYTGSTIQSFCHWVNTIRIDFSLLKADEK